MQHKMGIIGFGGMGTYHFKNLLKGQDVVAKGIWDIRECRREYARELGLHAYESLEDLLADDELELVLIATPNDLHKPIAIQALQAGKHVICEKPVTLSVADLEEMKAAAEKADRFLTVHQNRRWDRGYFLLKYIMEQGTLGPIYRIESRVHGAHGIPGDWRQDPKQGGGMVYDWGIHLIDQAAMLYPDAKIKSVYATLNYVTNQLADDGFMVDLLFDNGVHYLVDVGTSNFITLPRWLILGQDGTMWMDNWGNDVKVICAKGKDEKDVQPVVTAAGLTKTMAPRRQDTIQEVEVPDLWPDMTEYYRNITAHLESKEDLLVTLPQMTRVMRLIEAVFESAKTGQVIPFE
ncbi:MAG: Gfo/Idh/MocA family oxidoreductase [Clostridia bacterium]|nr:Gfo/Idh/MocA family oxidoreductase [Clostridia bacterium]